LFGLAALKLVRKQVKNDPSQTRIKPLTWPPILFESYRGLIARDWQEENLVAPTSMADLASARLIPQGPWTAWTAVEAVPALRPKASLTKSFALSRIYVPEPETDSAPTYYDPAVQRVADHLDLLEQVDGAGQQPSVKQLSRRVGLPLATVRRALEELGRKLDEST